VIQLDSADRPTSLRRHQSPGPRPASTARAGGPCCQPDPASPILPSPILPSPILPSPILPSPILPSPILPSRILPGPILPGPILPRPLAGAGADP
jgi:hypothetical protein